MRITSRGQVTIPQDIRKRYGLLPHTEVELVEVAGKVVLRKAAEGIRKAEGGGRQAEGGGRQTEGGSRQAREWIRRYRGSLKGGLTTDELMRLTRGDD